MSKLRLKAAQVQVIFAVTFGSILEWFEIYAYAYLAPVLSRVFFNFDSDLANLAAAFIIFGSGFLAKPFGAIIFGRIGDLIGRKKAFIWSITFLAIPTFLMGCLPTYATAGIVAPALLAFLRLIQSIPSAGETPGTGCYLYEFADQSNRRFLTSWGGVGNQIGAILGVLEVFLLHQFMSDEFLFSWGWRITFWSGGFIGLVGIYLRRKLHETPPFKELKTQHHVDKETVAAVIDHQKKHIAIGIAYGAINATTFYLSAAYLPLYFNTALGLSPLANFTVSISILILTTVLLPYFGWLGDRVNNRLMLVTSALLIAFSLINLYYSIINVDLVSIAIFGGICLIANTCITALITYRFMHLFRTSVRFTGSALSFNLADGIIGGFTPAISLFLVQYSGNQGAFCWFILASAIVSLLAYFKIKD